MASIEIRVLGEFEFIKQIIEGVARVFSNDGVFNTASGILLMLLLLWTSMAHIMNPDKAPFPFREFLMGIIGWMIFASPMSPKYDVELTSIRNMSDFTVVNDVPFIAAIPSAIASNFFSGMREIMEVSFTPVSYTSSERQADPLSTLVKMYDQRPPTSMQFSNAEKGYDLGKSVKHYIKNCYLVDHQLDGKDPTKSINYLRNATIGKDLFSELKVAYDFLQTDVYLVAGGSHFGEYLDCPTAFTRINAEFNSPALQSRITDFYNDKGVTQDTLRDASAMIYGSYGTGPSPYDIQIGMLQSYMIRDGLQNTSLETFADQMVLQGMRKRVYEKAGERALFNQIAIPVITALECFAFYMAPIMMLLSVLGGAGFAMIKKYMMLILFVNLWSFISIFVNLYTAISVENALAASDGFNPFSFDSLPDTILEVEGFLATSAALTASIPMLAMFLLYGGVHSMMGVMRNVASGSVDGNMGAPNVSSNMNGGVQKMGDTGRSFNLSSGVYSQSHDVGNNNNFGTSSINASHSSGWNASTQTAQNEVTSQQESYQQSLTQAVKSGIGTASSTETMNSAQWNSMTTDQKISSLAQSTSKGSSLSNDQKAEMALAAASEAGISLGGNFSLGAKGSITGRSVDTSSEAYQEMVQLAKQFNSSQSEATGHSTSSGTSAKSSDTVTFSDDKSAQAAKSSLDSYQQSLAKSKALSDAVSGSVVSSDSMNVNNAAAAERMDQSDLNQIWSGLSGDQKDRLSALGVNSVRDFKGLAVDSNGAYEGSAFGAIKGLANRLGDGDKNLSDDATDKRIASQMFGHVGSRLDGANGAGFRALSDVYNDQANAVSSIDNTNYSDKIGDAKNNASSAGADAREGSVNDNTWNEKVNRNTVNGVSGPDAETQRKFDDLKSTEYNGSDNLGRARAVSDYFSGPGTRWDADNVGESVNSHAVGSGVFIPTIASGTDSLLNGDYRNMDKDTQLDAILAGQYVSQNPEVMDMMTTEQQGRFVSNYHQALGNSDDNTIDMAKKVASGELSRTEAGLALGGGKYNPEHDTGVTGLQVETPDNAASTIRGNYFSDRAYEQASAIEQANAFDHSNTNVNENNSQMPEKLAELASTLANTNTTPETVENIAQGANSDNWANKLFGLNSHDSLNSAISGMNVLEGMRGVDSTFDHNLDTLQAEMRNNNAYIPTSIVAGGAQSDGTLGESFTHGDATYTMLGEHNGFNIYENESGAVFRQAIGSPGISEVHSGTVPANMLNHDGDYPALNMDGGSAIVDGMEYKSAGNHTVGDGDDMTILGNRYQGSDGEHYFLNKGQMKMIF